MKHWKLQERKKHVYKRTEAYNDICNTKNEIVEKIQSIINGEKILKCDRPRKKIDEEVKKILNEVREKYKLHYISIHYSSYAVNIDITKSYKKDSVSCEYIHSNVYIADVAPVYSDDNLLTGEIIIKTEAYPFYKQKLISSGEILKDIEEIELLQKEQERIAEKINKIISKNYSFYSD